MKDPAHEWDAGLVDYWRKFGDRIGVNVASLSRRAARKASRYAP
jgi:hypothetical protein